MHITGDPYNSSILRLIDGDGTPGRVPDVDDDTIELMDLTDDSEQQSRSDVTYLHRQLIHT